MDSLEGAHSSINTDQFPFALHSHNSLHSLRHSSEISSWCAMISVKSCARGSRFTRLLSGDSHSVTASCGFECLCSILSHQNQEKRGCWFSFWRPRTFFLIAVTSRTSNNHCRRKKWDILGRKDAGREYIKSSWKSPLYCCTREMSWIS